LLVLRSFYCHLQEPAMRASAINLDELARMAGSYYSFYPNRAG
jgi:hypothetical protein